MSRFIKSKNIGVFLFVFFFWLILTASFSWGEVIAGLVVSTLVTYLVGGFARTEELLILFNPLKLFFLIIYILVFLWEMIKANIDLAYRTLHPELPIKPGIVRISSELKSDLGLSILANSITLTPGTITADIEKKAGETCLYIHWIYVQPGNQEQVQKQIAGRFEKLLRRIFP